MDRLQAVGIFPRPRTIAIIPAYNEENSIAEVVREASRHVDEVLVIDDGSIDGTVEKAIGEGARVIRHSSNMGIGSALRTGYRYCVTKGFDIAVQLDADGQHDPVLIPQLLECLTKDGLDVVTGSRFLNCEAKDSVLIRRSGIKFFSFATSFLTSSRITDVTSGFRAYRSSALRCLSCIDQRHWAIGQTLLALRLGLRYGETPIRMGRRESGNSQFNGRTMFFYPIRMSRVILEIALRRRPKLRLQN